MANHASAKKMIRVIAKRTAVNRARRSMMRTAVSKVMVALQSGDKNSARVAFHKAESILQSCVNRGILHKNTAARKISRLSAKVKAMPV